ncbi:protein kinase [candidate division KSB1 bacterium]|nr:protein kinase [candidate division KSB1 bacterium]
MMDQHSGERERVIELLSKLGKAYLEKGQYSEAIDKFNHLIKTGIQNSFVYLNLSKAYILKEQYDDAAVDVFRKTLEFDPENKVINVILSQIFLDEHRDDDEACRVYRKALQYNSKNARELEIALAKIEMNRGNVQASRKLTEKIILEDAGHPEMVADYVNAGWKEGAFADVQKTLKQLYYNDPSAQLQHYYIQNIMKMAQDDSSFQMDADDVDVCQKYLDATEKFNNLIDISTYLFVRKHIGQFVQEESFDAQNDEQDVSEYELFLSESSLSNIWKKGLNTDGESQLPFVFADTIWNRIEAPPADENGHLLTEQIVRKYNTMILIYAPGTVQRGKESKWVAVNQAVQQLLKKCHYKRRLNDGILVIMEDLLTSLDLAQQILKKSYEIDPRDSAVQMRIVVHPFVSTDPDQFANDLTCGFTLFHAVAEGNEFLSEDKALFITGGTQELIKYNERIKTQEFRSMKRPFNNDELTVHQIFWQDPLERIRNGSLKKLDRLQIMNELHLNDTFNSFKAVDTFLDRLVILKILRTDFISQNGENIHDSFFKQANIIGKFSHPMIAKIYDINESDGFHYIAREFVEGAQISAPLTIFQQVQWLECIRMCIRIGEILDAAHQTGLVHGRIKPANVFVTEMSEIKITDFTIPHFSINATENSNTSLDSFALISPEQLNNEPISVQTDIYHVALLLYSLINQGNPFAAKKRVTVVKNINGLEPEPLSSKNEEIPETLDVILSQAMSKIPKNRYPTIREFMDDLNQLLESV